MKSLKLFILLALFSFAITSCSSNKEKTGEQDGAEAVAENLYSCPMHPEEVSEKAGKCSKCGMDLVLDYHSDPDADSHEGHDHQ